MLIRTFHNDYAVISQLGGDDTKEMYICKQYPINSMREYTVIKIKNAETAQRLVSFFTNNINQQEFTDFVEFFSSGGYMYFVYVYSSNKALANKITDDKCEFHERLEIGKNLIERMVFLNMPYVIQCDALTVNHCTVANNLTVSFNYTFADCRNFEHIGIQHVGSSLKHILNFLFRNEINLNSCRDINKYLDYLTEGTYETYIDLLYAYNEVYQKLQQKTNEEVEQPNTALFKFWEKTKVVLRVLRNILMALLIVAAVGYLVYTIIGARKPPAAQETFTYIGDVQFDQFEQSEKAEQERSKTNEIFK